MAVDALSAQKYYHLVRLMGRSASNIALEVVWCSAVAAFEILGHWVIGMWDIDSYGMAVWMFIYGCFRQDDE